eukprot:gene1453-1831_t
MSSFDNIVECIKKKYKKNTPKVNRIIDVNIVKDNTVDKIPIKSSIKIKKRNRNNLNNSNNNNNNQNQQQQTTFLCNWISTTKYSILTFLPKNLFEQFCKVANLYFLFILILCHTPISPVAAGPSAINLGIVLFINAVKEAYEDFHRYKSDKKINHQISQVLEGGVLVNKYWKDLKVGDIVLIKNEEQFPADLVMLSTSSEASPGHCYIETSNLDGETNLKCKQSLLETNYLQNLNNFQSFSAVIECEPPGQNLNKFDGRITLNGGEQYPLNIEQLLIRGTTLMNTKWVYGVVVYTGHETKYMLNTMATPSKRSKLELSMNKVLIYVLIAEGCLCLASAIAGLGYEKRVGIDSFYLQLNRQFAARTAERFLTFVVLYSTIVPISLYVTMEIVRVLQCISINRDKKMYHSETKTFAMARTSNLNEELGQVEYIFSDKTGTLTRNEMEFRMCSINGNVYGTISCDKNFQIGSNSVLNISQENLKGQQQFEMKEFSKSPSYANGFPADQKPFSIDLSIPENLEFFTVMAICNTVIPEIENDDNGVNCSATTIKYSSSSPDEIALVKGASSVGVNLSSRTPNSIGVNINGEEKVYSILNVLEFTSDRKRMSVVVREQNSSEIILYTKGADSSILPYVVTHNESEKITLEHCEDSLKKFSCNGLRTLCISKRIIPNEEYERWSVLFKQASISMTDRDNKIAEVSSLIEKDWSLLGVTGIEDKLQENVTGTISTLLKAGIKVWMLTGDKQETAINIGLACQLLSNLEIIIVNETNASDLKDSFTQNLLRIKQENSDYEARQQHPQIASLAGASSESNNSSKKEYALIINGQTLSLALCKEMEEMFYELTCLCKSVVCCRVTPFQKSEVVRIVKDRTKSITLAIGDGANDVSMIQKAHLGIGVSGKEGRQAVLASDFAISQFRFLERLVLVHGRYNYKRLCLLICYFFFKNLMSSLLQLWFSTNTQFSGQTFYDAVNILLYNLVFTSLPIIVMGVFEKDIASSYLRRYPSLYRECQLGLSFNHKIFWSWIALGIYASACVYFFTAKVFVEGPTNSGGKVAGMWQTSAAGFTSLVFVVNLRLALLVNSWTPLHHITIWGSLGVYALLETSYSTIYLSFTSYFHMVFLTTVSQYIFYCALVITVLVSLLPAYTVSYIKRNYYPQPIDIAQEIMRMDKEMERKKLKQFISSTMHSI